METLFFMLAFNHVKLRRWGSKKKSSRTNLKDSSKVNCSQMKSGTNDPQN